MSQGERYGIVVYMVAARVNAPPFKPWAWEICRDGEPLPARIRESGFKTEHTARLAAKVALKDFLSGLAQEQANRDR
jgi:hypothetical protein